MRASLKNSNILVVGGAGFIGSHLVDRLLEEKASKVVILDNLFLGSRKNIKKAEEQGAVFIHDDAEVCGTLEYVLNDFSIDIVFNCATKALNYSFINPSNAFKTNVEIIINLLELQRKGAYKTLCHFSSSEVYGSAVYEPMDENHPFKATTTYAAGKAAADTALFSYVNQYNLDAFIVRPFNNYGPRQNYEGVLAGVIPITARRILNGEKPEIHGTGKQSRDYIYVLDTVDSVIKLFPKMEKGDSINISTNGQISINDLMSTIVSYMNYDGEILKKEARAADVMCHNASNKKLKTMISFKPTPFSEGIKKTLDWYRDTLSKEDK